MQEKYVYLMHASLPVCTLTQERLREAGIDSRVGSYTASAPLEMYSAASLLGNKVTVPESKLNEAKKLLKKRIQSIVEENLARKKK